MTSCSRTSVRSTTEGVPFASSTDTSASPIEEVFVEARADYEGEPSNVPVSDDTGLLFDGEFEIMLGAVEIVGDANPVTGSDITLDLDLQQGESETRDSRLVADTADASGNPCGRAAEAQRQVRLVGGPRDGHRAGEEASDRRIVELFHHALRRQA